MTDTTNTTNTTNTTEQTFKADLAVVEINKELTNRHTAADIIQDWLEEILLVVAVLPPAEINTLGIWGALFGGDMYLTDRRKISTWLEAFTPLKVMWDKETGRFQKVKYSSRKATAMKRDSLDGVVWQITLAMKNLWSEFSPAKVVEAKASVVELKTLDPVLRTIIRSLAEKYEFAGEITPAQVIAEIDRLRQSPDFEGHVKGTVQTIQESEKHQEWITGRKAANASVEEQKEAAKAKAKAPAAKAPAAKAPAAKAVH